MTSGSHVRASTQYKREHKSDYGKEKIELLYEDKDVAVILKPSGMLSVPYPGSKARTAVAVLEALMRQNGTYSARHRPLVVHRLDRDTSGVMLFALNEAAQKKLVETWHTAVTERIYHAVAENPADKRRWLPDSGLIDEPLSQNAYHFGYVPKKGSGAKTVPARTHFAVIQRGTTHTLFELELDTGKKNQIRAHLASKGYPLAGDENYFAKTDPFGRLALHARTIAFRHPSTGSVMRFEVAEPEQWAQYVQKGDPHPAPPVWKQPRPRRDQGHMPAEGQLRPTNKQLSKMDYISRAKLLGGRP